MISEINYQTYPSQFIKLDRINSVEEKNSDNISSFNNPQNVQSYFNHLDKKREYVRTGNGYTGCSTKGRPSSSSDKSSSGNVAAEAKRLLKETQKEKLFIESTHKAVQTTPAVKKGFHGVSMMSFGRAESSLAKIRMLLVGNNSSKNVQKEVKQAEEKAKENVDKSFGLVGDIKEIEIKHQGKKQIKYTLQSPTSEG